MRGSTFRHQVGSITYLIDAPRLDVGVNATISAVREETSERGAVSRILHCDRINLDKAREREAFAEKAGTDPEHLRDIRARLLDFLASSERPTDDAPYTATPAGFIYHK